MNCDQALRATQAFLLKKKQQPAWLLRIAVLAT